LALALELVGDDLAVAMIVRAGAVRDGYDRIGQSLPYAAGENFACDHWDWP